MKLTAALALLSLAPAAAFAPLRGPAARRARPLPAVADPATLPQFAGYGKNQFAGTVADGYLQKQGLSVDDLKDPSWVTDKADGVAAAVLEW